MDTDQRPCDGKLPEATEPEFVETDQRVSDEAFHRRALFDRETPDAQKLITRADELYAWRAYEVAERLRIEELLDELRQTNPAGVHSEELEQLAQDEKIAPQGPDLTRANLRVETEVITDQMQARESNGPQSRAKVSVKSAAGFPARVYKKTRGVFRGEPNLDPEIARKREIVNKTYAEKLEAHEKEHREAEQAILRAADNLFAAHPEHICYRGKFRTKEILRLTAPPKFRGPTYLYEKIVIVRKVDDSEAPIQLHLIVSDRIGEVISIPQKKVKRTELTGPITYDYHKLRFNSSTGLMRFLESVTETLESGSIQRRDDL